MSVYGYQDREKKYYIFFDGWSAILLKEKKNFARIFDDEASFMSRASLSLLTFSLLHVVSRRERAFYKHFFVVSRYIKSTLCWYLAPWTGF